METSIATTSRKGERVVPEGIAARIRRGIALYAERGREIREDRGAYMVPSCKGYGFYRVEDERCNCPDFSRAKLNTCKHHVASLIHEAKRPVFVTVGRGHEHPELPVPSGCRYFSDTYSTPTYRVMEFRGGRFVRLHGECYLSEALTLAQELSGIGGRA